MKILFAQHATIVHEFGHAVGFEHEHQRPVRDNYVQIQWGNVGQGWEYAFDKYSSTHIDNRQIGYDYRSVMHYGKTVRISDFPKHSICNDGVNTSD